MDQQTFFQIFTEGDTPVTCYWGIKGESASFLVIDFTNGLGEHARFSLHPGPDGNRGILESDGDSRCVDECSRVFVISWDGLEDACFRLSAQQLTDYIEAGTHPLSIEGVKAFEAETPAV